HARMISTRERDEVTQGGPVAVHGEDRVGDDQAAASLWGRSQDGFECPGVAVRIDVDGSPGEPTAVDDARVVERVAEDVVPTTDERADRADVRLVARREEEGRL